MSYYSRQMTPREVSTLPHQPPICDFCAEHAPEFIYAAIQSSAGVPGFIWRWVACPDCHKLIQAGAFGVMIDTIARGLERSTPHVPLLIRQMCASRSLRDFHLYVWNVAPASE